MNYNYPPRVFYPANVSSNMYSNHIFYRPINTQLPINKDYPSCFYYEDFWGLFKKSVKVKPKLIIETDLNNFAMPFTPSPKESFFVFGDNSELEELEVNKPEPMATLVSSPKKRSPRYKSKKNKKW